MTKHNDGRYGIDDNITRAEVAVMLVRALGLEYKGLQSQFTDVPSGFWAEGHIAAAANRGILSGYEDGRFGPDDYVTRSQLAVMISRAYSLKEDPNNLKSFTDVPVGFWAASRIQTLASNGIVSGYRDGRFGVDDFATRAQFSKFLSKSIIFSKAGIN